MGSAEGWVQFECLNYSWSHAFKLFQRMHADNPMFSSGFNACSLRIECSPVFSLHNVPCLTSLSACECGRSLAYLPACIPMILDHACWKIQRLSVFSSGNNMFSSSISACRFSSILSLWMLKTPWQSKKTNHYGLVKRLWLHAWSSWARMTASRTHAFQISWCLNCPMICHVGLCPDLKGYPVEMLLETSARYQDDWSLPLLKAWCSLKTLMCIPLALL